MQIGDMSARQIIALMEREKWTQSQIAYQAGMSRQALNAIKNGDPRYTGKRSLGLLRSAYAQMLDGIEPPAVKASSPRSAKALSRQLQRRALGAAPRGRMPKEKRSAPTPRHKAPQYPLERIQKPLHPVYVEEDTKATQRIREVADRIERYAQRQSQDAPSRAVSTPPGPQLIEAPKSQRAYQRLPDGYAEAFEKEFGMHYRPDLSQDENVYLALKRQDEATQERVKLQKSEDPFSILFRKQRERQQAQQTPAPQPVFDPAADYNERLKQQPSLGAPAPQTYT